MSWRLRNGAAFRPTAFSAESSFYNYKVGEVIGAVSVSIPMTTLYQGIGINLQRDLLYRLGILLPVFATMVFLVRKFIITPILVACATMNRVTKTGDLIPIH